MDPMAEEQLDYEDEEYGSSQKTQYHGGGAISALAEDEIIGEDDEYDDLYNDVNVGEGFLQLQQQQSEPAPATSLAESQSQTNNIPQPKSEPVNTQLPNVNISTPAMVPEIQPVNSGFRGQIPVPQQMNPVNESVGMLNSDSGGGPRGGVSQMPPNNQMVNNVNVNEAHVGPQAVDTGATMLFVGELHWWTTDAEIESVLSQYGRVKEIKFFDERASGKSKGYCQVEFYESAAASACKEGMDGYVFNGRACVVAFASPMTIRQMGSSYANKSQAPPQTQPPGRKPFNDGGNAGGRGNGGNFPGGGDGGGGGRNFGDGGGGGGRNFGRGGWGGRGGQGILNRGPGGNFPVRGRGGGGGFGAKNMVNNNPQGAFGNPAFGGPPGGFMHPQGVMGAGFDPTYMGRGAGYGFPGPAFPGMMPQFPGVNPMGLAGVAPHVNPAFFGRGMGMMGATGMEGHHPGMWGGDMSGGGGWGGGVGGGGEEQRTRESSYGGEDGGSEYGYGGEDGNDKAAGGGSSGGGNRSKERVSEREWSGSSEKRQHREDREQEPARERYESRDHHSSRYKEEKDGGYREHSRQKERDFSYDDDYESRAHSSRPRSRSRAAPDESDHRSRSRDADYGKRRRLPSE